MKLISKWHHQEKNKLAGESQRAYLFIGTTGTNRPKTNKEGIPKPSLLLYIKYVESYSK